jgi:hypothetical protein
MKYNNVRSVGRLWFFACGITLGLSLLSSNGFASCQDYTYPVGTSKPMSMPLSSGPNNGTKSCSSFDPPYGSPGSGDPCNGMSNTSITGPNCPTTCKEGYWWNMGTGVCEVEPDPAPSSSPSGPAPAASATPSAEVMCPLDGAPMPAGINRELYKCVYDCNKPAANDCDASQVHPIDIYDNTGTNRLTGFYDLNGKRGPSDVCLSATSTSADCPIQVTARFEALCPNGTLSCRRAQTIHVSYEVLQDPAHTPQGITPRAALRPDQPYTIPANTLFAVRNGKFECPVGQKVLGIDNYGTPTCGVDPLNAKLECVMELASLACGQSTTKCSPPFTKPACNP